jgi:hypothetical protein
VNLAPVVVPVQQNNTTSLSSTKQAVGSVLV